MKRDDIIYVAGLIDTAAYITIKKIRGEVTGPLVSLRVSIGKKEMELIRQAYGGYYNRESLVMNQKSVRQLIDDVGPFLRNKKEHADILTDFFVSISEFKRYKKGKNPKTGLPDRMRSERERLWKRMQVLNEANP